MKKFDPTLYFITDSTGLTEEEFLNRTREALKGGATLLQLREKDKTTREYIDLGTKVHQLTKAYNVPLIIDDRIDVAMAIGAEGVHLGQSDMPIDTARKILGSDAIIGATAKTVAQALEAYEQGADYLGVGAIYPTTTKVKTVLTSTETLDAICKAVSIPVNPIGGLNKTNTQVLQGIGIAGLCVVSAIMKADEPKVEAEILLSIAKELKEKY
ncbi:MAG: thiamine phosphate synthase [Anaerovoracaceae bacterium]